MTKTSTSVATTQPQQQTGVAKTQAQLTKQFFTQENVKKRFEELLGKKSVGFVSSVLQCVNSNKSLANADTNTVFQAAMMAATLDLPINQNLGFAYIIPYNENFKDPVDDQWKQRAVAQMQIGWRGFVQLAQRSGQYLRINVTEVYENQFEAYNNLTEELKADFDIEGEGNIVGYASYFKLINGFEKTVYWSRVKVEKHAKKYSIAYKGSGKTPWKDVDQFHEMGKKTVLKNMLSKWGILSIEMQKAMVADQGIIKDAETEDIEYTDNTFQIQETQKVNPEEERIALMIGDAKTAEDLKAIEKDVPDTLIDLFNQKKEEVK